ncbi:hypothetical protein CK203_105714 [Vitis vinifera]|uniref:Uncharacterized protein n=1 Tax=Vitis vinifera TaxID=29760 RepID=A0A438BPI8_VITVI|nr:hypothetical protein CK203_105714 [Vitis vinifera]
MSTSSLEQAILKISKVMEDFVEKVQDSIEKLTNLDIAREKRKLPPQPHHNLQGTNAKRSRKVLKIDTLVGDFYDNSMDQPSIENHKVQDDKGLPEPFKASTSLGKRRETNSIGPNGKDANFVWDPRGIQHEVGMMLAKIEVMVKTRENRGEKPKTEQLAPPISATVGNISITSQSSFHMYYMSFQSLGSQESSASSGAKIFAPCETTYWHTSAISHTSSQFSHRAKQGAKISHSAKLSAKLDSSFEAWEVRNLWLQTVHDLDLKRRSYGRLKTTMQS